MRPIEFVGIKRCFVFVIEMVNQIIRWGWWTIRFNGYSLPLELCAALLFAFARLTDVSSMAFSAELFIGSIAPTNSTVVAGMLLLGHVSYSRQPDVLFQIKCLPGTIFIVV